MSPATILSCFSPAGPASLCLHASSRRPATYRSPYQSHDTRPLHQRQSACIVIDGPRGQPATPRPRPPRSHSGKLRLENFGPILPPGCVLGCGRRRRTGRETMRQCRQCRQCWLAHLHAQWGGAGSGKVEQPARSLAAGAEGLRRGRVATVDTCSLSASMRHPSDFK